MTTATKHPPIVKNLRHHEVALNNVLLNEYLWNRAQRAEFFKLLRKASKKKNEKN